MGPERVIRVFISSPGDVRSERRRAALVCNRLSREFGRFFEVRPVLWEYEPMLAAGHFQDVIEPAPSDADIVGVILWSRLGTPLPESTDKRRYEGLDGRAPVTGTEWEFEDALRARHERARRGEAVTPELIVYKNVADPQSRANSADGLRQAAEQLEALHGFWHRHFETADGQFKLAYATYDTTDAFEARFEADMRGLLRQRLPAVSTPRYATAADSAIAWHQGSPFRGLQAFDAEHSAVFFGRAEDQRKVIDALAERANAGTAFVLVLGASGTGKSSLVRAGVAPDLTVPGVVARAEAWRRAVLRPAADGVADDLFVRAAQSLTAAVPEIAAELDRLGPDTGDLAGRLRDGSAQDLLRASLYRAAEQNGHAVLPGELPPVRLLVIVDQLEELFTAADRITPDTRRAFVDLLQLLATSGVAWVLATMRSDFYGRLTDLPVLRDLAAGDGLYLLAPPTDAQLRQMIELPALAAGLTYEEEDTSGIPLSARLLEEAQGPGALPLLEFALNELYARDITGDNTVLTFASHAEMGGLKGALAHQAEAALADLGPAHEPALRSVLLALVTQRPDGAPTARLARKSDLAGTDEQAEVVEALIRARLLVGAGTDRDISVRLSHEALLTSWPRFAELIAAEADFIRARDRIAARAALWTAEGEPDGRLLDGIDLVEGQQILTDRRGDLTEPVIRLVETSLAAAESRRMAELAAERGKRRMYQALGGVAVLFAIVAGIGGWKAVQNQQKAERLAIEAESSARAAEQSRQEAMRSLAAAQRRESLFFAVESEKFRTAGYAAKALAMAWLALPRATGPEGSSTSRARPLVADAVKALDRARDELTEGQHFNGHEGAVISVAFSPDGRTVLTGSDDKTARLWDVATGSELRKFVGHESWIGSVAFSPDGRAALTGSKDKTIRLWDVATGRELKRLEGHTGEVLSVVFSPDGRNILSAGAWERMARLWDVESATERIRIGGHADGVTGVAFSPDGKTVLTGSRDKTARLWDAATGAELQRFVGHELLINAVAFSPDGRTVLTGAGWFSRGSKDATARLWDVATGAEVKRLEGHENMITGVAFSPDGKTVLTGSYDNSLRLWDVETGAQMSRFGGHRSRLNSVAFSPDGRTVLSGSEDKTARLWTVARGAEITRIVGRDDMLWDAAFSPDGRTVLTGSGGMSSPRDKTARLWDAATGAELKRFIGHENNVWSVAFHPDGQSILTGSRDRTARLWDVATAAEAGRFDGHDDEVTSVAFSPDGRLVLTGSKDKTLRLWNAKNGDTVTIFNGHDDSVTSVAFSPDGRTVLSGSKDKTARLWDRSTGGELKRFGPHFDSVTSVAFAPDGRHVLTGSLDQTARLWNVETGKMAKRLQTNSGYVWSVAFSPDGRTVLTTGDGPGNKHTAQLYDLATGMQIKRFAGHNSNIQNVAFGPDGRTVLTASGDWTVRLWRTYGSLAVAIREAGDIVARLRPLSATECARYGIENAAACR